MLLILLLLEVNSDLKAWRHGIHRILDIMHHTAKTVLTLPYQYCHTP
jgi:hypothetical protein